MVVQKKTEDKEGYNALQIGFDEIKKVARVNKPSKGHFGKASVPPMGPLVFVVINYISYRRQIFSGMETGEKGQLGTVYFPISFAILIPLLWAHPALLVASLMPMTWGDAFAAIIGKRWGAHTFSIVGQTRSIEGSLAMFVFSFAATFIALVVFGQSTPASLILSLLVALVASIVEAISPFGIDNLTVPLTSALVLFLLK